MMDNVSHGTARTDDVEPVRRVDEERERDAASRTDDKGGAPDHPAEAKTDRDLVDLAGPDKEKTGDAGNGGDEKQAKPDDNPPAPPPKSVFAVVGLILLALVAWGGYKHWRSYEESKDTASNTTNRVIEVQTTASQRLDKPLELTLPGETQAFDTANIYPRATGYIDQRKVDIGTRVKQGDLLVHITAPDLDQQLAQAEAQIGQTRAALVQAQAQVSQAVANVNLAKVNFARTNQLTQQGYDSLQNRDTQQANVDTQAANVEAAKAGVRVAEANIQAQQANIDRLKALASFEEVRAPFDGVVTSRNIDLGELVNADSSSGNPMFTIVRDDMIRVMVRVPQSAAIGVHDGLEAKVKVAQMPTRDWVGRVQRSSVALLYSSRSLTTEVDVANPDGQLRPGLYVSVTFQIPREHPDVNVPAEALMFNQHGMQVGTVADGRLTLHQVNIYRDHGTTVDLREGLNGNERVVLNPPATLKDGATVKEIREEDQKKQDEDDKAKPKTASNQEAKTDTAAKN